MTKYLRVRQAIEGSCIFVYLNYLFKKNTLDLNVSESVQEDGTTCGADAIWRNETAVKDKRN